MISFGQIQFASPWVLAFLLLLPIWWIIRRRRRPSAIVFSRVPVLKTGPKAGRRTTLILFTLRNLLLASTIVALSRPRAGAHAEDQTSEGINIVLAIDLSSSMLAQDFQPQNRLEVAKDVVKRFIAARTSDRIGVVAFAAEALTQVPLTTDYPVVNAAVDNLAADVADGARKRCIDRTCNVRRQRLGQMTKVGGVGSARGEAIVFCLLSRLRP